MTAVQVALKAIEQAFPNGVPAEDVFMRRSALSRYLQDRIGFGAESTLRVWAVRGEGPPFRRVNGRTVVYSKADVDTWIEEVLAARYRSSHPGARPIEPIEQPSDALPIEPSLTTT